MKFVLKPSLEHLTLVKIGVSLWNQNDVKASIMERSSPRYFTHREQRWVTIYKIVEEKVPLLPLPQLLKEKLSGFIKPIGLEVEMWMEYNRDYFHVSLLAELCWTSQGTLDTKRTAKVLVSNENLDIVTRYEIACEYCLEDDIHKLWENVPEDLKESFFYKSRLFRFWSHSMKQRELGNVHISYKDGFCKPVYCNNKEAAEYFLQKLTLQEREELLVDAAEIEGNSDILYIFISEMTEKQQMEVFKNKPVRVLQCFLKWPLQNFFIETANCMWDFLSKDDYNRLVIDIVNKVEEGYEDWNYRELFKEFWQKSPDVKKSSIINDIHNLWLLPSLFYIKDKENIRLILKDANLTVKEKLIYNHGIESWFKRSIEYSVFEWDMLEFFIQECLPSKNVILKFEEEVKKHFYFEDFSRIKKHKWNQLFSFSDDSICTYDKRSLDKDESSSSKQF